MVKNVSLKNEQLSDNLITNDEKEEYLTKVVPGCVSVSLPGPFSKLSARFYADIRSLEVIFDDLEENTNREDTECKTHIEVLDKVYHIFTSSNSIPMD